MVEHANREAPAHARIYRSKIAIIQQQQSFIRAAKGSVTRLETLKAFKDEIEALYADERFGNDSTQEGSDDDPEFITKIHTIFARALQSFQKDTAYNVDIFSLGVDSLDVLALVHALNKAIRGANVTTSIIYSNPTVERLAKVMSGNISKLNRQAAIPFTREQKIEKMVAKYTEGMVRPKRTASTPELASEHIVVITGSTGSLGTHMLEQLLRNPDVGKVYCMNRSDKAEARQRSSFEQYHNLSPDFSKATFLKTDFDSNNFGLPVDVYSTLLSTVTVFIHAAWSVYFNLSLGSYEGTHIAGTRRAVDFAAAATHKPSVIFISSIASVGAWNSIGQDGSPVPETVTTLFDPAITLPQGYGESKHVAARVLAVASHRLGIKTTIVRAGQLAGPTVAASGAPWNRHEWLPTMVHTSKILKKLPCTLGNMERVDWVPMDIAAGTVIDITLADADEAEQARVFHLANLHTTTWSQLYPVILEFFRSEGVDIEGVEYNAWVDELKQIPSTKENAERLQGLKLLDFYESLRPEKGMGLPALDTRLVQNVSPTLRGGRAVDAEIMRKWLGQWKF